MLPVPEEDELDELDDERVHAFEDLEEPGDIKVRQRGPCGYTWVSGIPGYIPDRVCRGHGPRK
jgi:hypothetical protein